MLKYAALATGALLAGCQSTEPAVTELPEAYHDHLGDLGGTLEHAPVKAEPVKIVSMPKLPPQKSAYGDIMPRTAWTPSSLQLPGGKPMESVSRVTIHHSGDSKPFMGESIEEIVKHLQIVQHGHIQRGMIDIGYHFAVDRVGRVWQLRWLQYEGEHVRLSKDGTRNNAHNVGIVMLGDFNVQAPTIVSRDRLLALVRQVRQQYAPTNPKSIAALMHGEIVSTDCPGKSLRPALLDARQKGLM